MSIWQAAGPFMASIAEKVGLKGLLGMVAGGFVVQNANQWHDEYLLKPMAEKRQQELGGRQTRIEESRAAAVKMQIDLLGQEAQTEIEAARSSLQGDIGFINFWNGTFGQILRLIPAVNEWATNNITDKQSKIDIAQKNIDDIHRKMEAMMRDPDGYFATQDAERNNEAPAAVGAVPAVTSEITTSETEIAQQAEQDPDLLHRVLVARDGLMHGGVSVLGSVLGLPHWVGEKVGVDMPDGMSAESITDKLHALNTFVDYNLTPHALLVRAFKVANGGDLTERYDVKQVDDLDKAVHKYSSFAGEALAAGAVGGGAAVRLAPKFMTMGKWGKMATSVAGQEAATTVTDLVRKTPNLPVPVFAP